MAEREERRQSGVTITNREIYDLLQANTQLTRDLVGKVSTIETRDGDHEARLRALEKWRWKASGLTAFIAWSGALVVSVIWH